MNITGCVLSEPELKMYGPAQTTAVTAAPLTGTVLVDDDRFATLPGLAAFMAPLPTPLYRPFNEEELHTSFEQAISDRVLAVKNMLQQHESRRVTTGLLSSQGVRPVHEPMLPAVEQAVCDEEPRKKSLSLLSSKRWLRGITYGSFALMLMLTGFDLMGMLVLFHH